MTIRAHSRREFLVGAASAAALGISGSAGWSAASAFATPLKQAPAAARGAGLIPYGAAVRSDALVAGALHLEGSHLWIEDESIDLDKVGRIVVVGAQPSLKNGSTKERGLYLEALRQAKNHYPAPQLRMWVLSSD